MAMAIIRPGGYGMTAALVCEVVMTFAFLFVILGSTHGRAPAGFAPIAIGLCLTLIHLISIPGHQHVGQSGAFDRARSVRGRLGAGSALAVLGGADRWARSLAGFVYRWLSPDEPKPADVSGR